ncbi:hypothetical protein V144x_20490 [Gimesia aquarii]|uniref:Uncharacterized protein n=1 Tax=Gimesia aquarii TaxID=2527964 RepID=A0A517VUB0_9PLAN|nr:hypothetical protein V144x_20490 [Gimesia aquarii]
MPHLIFSRSFYRQSGQETLVKNADYSNYCGESTYQGYLTGFTDKKRRDYGPFVNYIERVFCN